MSRLISMYGDFEPSIPSHVGGDAKTVKCDVAVIGGGGAGLSAAARAAELGAKVVLIEKMDVLGGNTRMAGGLLCTNSKTLTQAGFPDMTEDHIDQYRRHHLYQLDQRIYERFIRNTGRYYDWLVENGLDTENRRFIMDRVVMIRDRTTWEPLYNPAYGPGLMGSAVTDLLIKLCNESENVTLLTATKATALKTDASGAVIGITAIGNGIDWDIDARTVILASGGFGCNQELLKKYFPQYFTSDNFFTHYCLKHNTGDGIYLAEEIGAETGKNMSIGLESMTHIPGSHILQRMMLTPWGIIVSATGKRFVSEDDMENGEYALDQQPDGLGWFIFNESHKKALYDSAIENARYGDWMPEYEQVDIDINNEIKEGLCVKGDSIESLASCIGAPPEVLRATLEEYEGFCEEGIDHAFRKDPEYLVSMGLEGPWYGIRLIRKFDVTMGGISIDYKNHALRPDQSIIPNLYVCGDNASNWMGADYGPLFSSFAWAVNSGFLTAEEICGQ